MVIEDGYMDKNTPCSDCAHSKVCSLKSLFANAQKNNNESFKTVCIHYMSKNANITFRRK